MHFLGDEMTMSGKPGRLFQTALALAISFPHGAQSAAPSRPDSLSRLSVSEIKEEIASTRTRLDQLPRRLIRESGGTLGFGTHLKANKPGNVWVEVDLLETHHFDTLVVVPAVLIDERKAVSNFAFPEHFQIRGYASAEDSTGHLLFDSRTDTAPLTPFPDRSPVIIHCPGSSARRIRIIPNALIKEPISDYHIFALSELLVFDGERNLALGKPVNSPKWTRHAPVWHKQYLTDGYMPYSGPGSKTDTPTNGCRMVIPAHNSTPPSITLDLGREYPLDEIRLHPLQMDRNFVVFHKAALGFPPGFRIDVSNDADFTAPTRVFATGPDNYPSPGHRLACFAANGASGRFVRILANRPAPHPRNRNSLLAFAEIEVISRGIPVSPGADVRLSHQPDIKRLPPSMLTDGVSSNGRILPMRSWLADLSERNLMETRLAALRAELQDRYLRQSRTIRRLGWGTGATLFLALAAVLWQQLIRQRQIYRLKSDLAADLHDEFGGTFSGLALLADELANEKDMPRPHIPRLARIAEISRTSANNARALVQILESRGVTGGLIGEMRATAKLLMLKHHCQLDLEGGKLAEKLTPKQKWHLLLFFKEALNNIVKHARASSVEIRLRVTTKQLCLTITDNGRGLDGTPPNPPAHLAMRAAKLNAKLDLSAPPAGGTTVNLTKML